MAMSNGALRNRCCCGPVMDRGVLAMPAFCFAAVRYWAHCFFYCFYPYDYAVFYPPRRTAMQQGN